ncbi:hypothetical protein EJB05_31414, partial [Eragrostis curvula]
MPISRCSRSSSLQSDIKSAMTAMVKLRLALSLVVAISVLCRHCSAANTPADNYLISCGSDADTPVGQRVFVGDDSGSVTLTASHSAAVKAPPNSVVSGSDDDAALYQMARVFTAPSSYAFKITNRGRHFVRLHFFPFASEGYDLAAASFKVSTQDAVLIDSFNASSSPVRDEFLLDVDRDTLIITFVPESGGLAFVNAVEVVSVPGGGGLMDDPAETLVPAGDQRRLGVAVPPLQTAYRVNVGGPAVAADGDALWREWTTDQRFLTGSAGTREVAYSGRLNGHGGLPKLFDEAPDIVYATAREMDMSNWVDTSKQMTWQFDVGEQPASYLIRLHLCDIVSRAPHLLLLDAYVNGLTAVSGLDLSAQVGDDALAVPYFMDFIVESSDPTGKISINVGSSSTMKRNSTLPGPILNGIEIMRINFSSGSVVVVVEPVTWLKKHQVAIVVGSLCGGAFAVASVAAVLFVVLRKKKEGKVLPEPSPSPPPPSTTPWIPLVDRLSFLSGRRPSTTIGTGSSGPPSFTIPSSSSSSNKTGGGGSPMPMSAAAYPAAASSYRFPLAVVRAATNDFDERLVVGRGGFGAVYRGALPGMDGAGATVAVKRAAPESRQGAREFRAEVETLSALRHRHLVSLVGYCDEAGELILLYEYMAGGSLRSRLPALTWAQRLDACAGAAAGLLYLHTAMSSKPVIHRDVKSSNILLDAGLAAKLADFGLSRAGPEPGLDHETHVSTAVKGSFGYVDPEYARTRRLTPKSDVYSFGVVLLEALCGRPVVDPRLPKPMANLVEWGLHWQRRGQLEEIVDRRVAGEVRPAALLKYGETVARCLAERGADRPPMEDVVWSLKFVARLQDGGDGFDFLRREQLEYGGSTDAGSVSSSRRSSSTEKLA